MCAGACHPGQSQQTEEFCVKMELWISYSWRVEPGMVDIGRVEFVDDESMNKGLRTLGMRWEGVGIKILIID